MLAIAGGSDRMRNIAVSIFVVAATLMTCEVAFSGQREAASSPWFGKLFQSTFGSRLETREAELKVLMEIGNEQETAWLEYILARRQYAETINFHRRQEFMSLTLGDADTGFDTTLPAQGADSPVPAAKLVLKAKFDALYALLDEVQKARADKELTPGECGR